LSVAVTGLNNLAWLHKLPSSTSSLNCLHTTVNVDGRDVFHNQALGNSTLFEPHVLTTFHFDWHCTGVMNNSDLAFFTLIKNMAAEAKLFSPSLYFRYQFLT
jgi:hypothetical protein